jgi:preprotein translocase subunit SecE
MGKVKDEQSASTKPSKPAKGKPSNAPRGVFAQYFANLLSLDVYKPNQGWYARLYTFIGLALIVASGIWRLYEFLQDETPAWRLGVPTLVAAILIWIVYRTVQFPPFAEFLIATEAEMNKVSWTSKDDLYRATVVVLTTVVVMAIFLFMVDWVWLAILKKIGVLQFSGGGAFGSQA